MNTLKKELMAMFEVAENRMLSALTSFYSWKWFNQVTNTKYKGKESAEKYVDTINKYKAFLRHVMVISYKSFVIDLSVFFDANKYSDRFSLTKINNLLKQIVSGAKFKELNDKIQRIRSKHGVTTAFLLDELRNADVIHQEIKPKSRTINYEKFEEFFKAIQEILNLISYECDNSTSSWEHIEKEVIHDMESMFRNLERGEITRLKEIDEKYKKLKNNSAPQKAAL